MSADRQEKAIQQFKRAKKTRLETLRDISEGLGCDAHEEVLVRECIQTTMMCDKKKMLTTAALGLKTSKAQIRRVFEFFERIRNYVAHPSAAFTRNEDVSSRLDNANHERVDEKEETWRSTFSLLVEDELGVTEVELAKAVRECHEVIADIDRAQSATV